MLSYRHGYHAGNYADVLKHLVQVQILKYLKEKPAPFLYLDTHAGAGFYDLNHPYAKKNAEHEGGIARLWQGLNNLPQALADYLSCIEAHNSNGLVCYPGSPLIAQQLVRPQQDRIIACEKHPADFATLKNLLGKNKQQLCVNEDGYLKAISVLPPKEKRGCIFIDPSYEVKQEYFGLVDAVQKMHRRFATGVYAIWYPVADAGHTHSLVNGLIKTGIRRIQKFELGISRDHSQPGMTGTGMLVINPPWQLAAVVEPSLAELQRLLAPYGYWESKTLVGE